MTYIVGSLSAVAALLLFLWASRISAYERGFQAGSKQAHTQAFADGYERGRLDADNWWINMENETEAEQRHIGREDAA